MKSRSLAIARSVRRPHKPIYVIPKRSFAAKAKHLGFPALSPSGTSGKLVQWLKREGDSVKLGEPLASIETDKATIDWPSPEDGFVAKLLISEGSTNDINTPAAILVAKKEQVAEFANYKQSSPAPTNPPAAPPEPPKAQPDAPPEPPKSQPPPQTQSKPSKSLPPFLPLPMLSPTMEEGKVAQWFKKDGDKFSTGDTLAEIETDKATLAMDANHGGIIAKILVQPGVVVKAGDPIAAYVKSGDVTQWKDLTFADYKTSSSAPVTPATPASAPGTPSSAPVTPSSTPTPSPSAPNKEAGRTIASPLAKVEAGKKGVDLSQIVGTGPNNRIIAADVAEFVPQPKTVTEQPKAVPSSSISDFTDIPNSNIRKITANRLTSSKQNIPHYYLTVDINVDKLLDIRTTLNAMSKQDEFKISVNDFVIKAAAIALRAKPEVNSEWRGDSIRRYNSVHINVAVNTERGLLTPIVRDADKLGLQGISKNVKELSKRALEGKQTPTDLELGTFTISNLGMFGITNFSAVINPPQAAILAVGGIRKVLTVEEVGTEQKFKNSNVLTVTLSCDHRVVDGAVGAEWLRVFKDTLENPLKFLL